MLACWVMAKLLGAWMQAQGAPAALPVGETGGANGGAASRGTGCRAVTALPYAGPSQPEAGRKPLRSAPGAEPQATAARQRGAMRRLQGACATRQREGRCTAGSAVERPVAPQAPGRGGPVGAASAAGPSTPAGRSLYKGRCGVSPLKGVDRDGDGSSAGEGLPHQDWELHG